MENDISDAESDAIIAVGDFSGLSCHVKSEADFAAKVRQGLADLDAGRTVDYEAVKRNIERLVRSRA